MPAAIKQKLQASRRSQVVNGTELNPKSAKNGKMNERKKETGKAEKVPSVLWDQ